MKYLVILILSIILPLEYSYSSILPNDQIFIGNQNQTNPGITEEDFNKLADSTVLPWVDIAQKKGKELVVLKDWTSWFVASYANQIDNKWIVDLRGGLARNPYMTKDGFVLIICHELGHHFAGFPFAYEWVWYSTEGQADYFATHVCARKVWADDIIRNAAYRNTVAPQAKIICDKAWQKTADQNLCYRALTASLDLGIFYAEVGNSEHPQFNSHDPTVVDQTDPGHPSPQCRLDSYIAGSICKAKFDMEFIPGLKHPKGQDSIEAELEAAPYSCTAANQFNEGLRPACWYRARM